MFTSSPMFSVLAMLTPPALEEYMAIVPGSIVAVLALLVVLIDTFHRTGTRRDYLAHISAIGLGLAIFSCYVLWDNSLSGPTFHGMLYLDKFSLFFAVLACSAGGLAMLQAPAYLKNMRMDRGEFYMLILFSVCGTIFMASAADMLTIFLALELMSIPIYCLAGFLRRDVRGAESALKYFVLGAFSAALMLYGIALIYGVTGTTNLEYIGSNLSMLISNPEAARSSGMLIMVGMLLVLSGFAFKIAAVPFHIWTPDVYTGSPTPGVGFMATAIKAGAFAALIRVCFIAFGDPMLRGGFFGMGWVDFFFFLSAASMILGNAVALTQSNVKRMLAYSSIAHAGYILLGFTAAGAKVQFFMFHDAVLFYLLTYTFATLGAFGVLSYLGRRGSSVETYDDLAGLGIKYPLAGVMMGIFMFSSAGVPPTAGFVGKLFVFRTAVEVYTSTGSSAFKMLAVLGVLTSVAGAYYYLRVLVCMYMRKVERDDIVAADTDRGAHFALFVCAAMTLGTGVLPGKALELARESVLDFQGASPALKRQLDEGKKMLEQVQTKSLNSLDPAAKVAQPPQD